MVSLRVLSQAQEKAVPGEGVGCLTSLKEVNVFLRSRSMNLRGFSYALVATAALVSTAFQLCVAQTSETLNPHYAAPLAASASTAVPALVPFSGLIAEPDGKPVSGETAITFLIFKGQEGSE